MLAPRAILRGLLKDPLARGSAVNGLFLALSASVAIVATIVSARVLGPEGVGVLAIGFLLVEFMSVVDNLPTSAFIRDYSIAPERRKVATAFGVKAIAGIAIAALVAGLSPAISAFFRVPLVVPLAFAFIPVASVIDSIAIMTHEARRDMVRRNLPALSEQLLRLGFYAYVAFVPFLAAEAVPAIAIATLAASVGGTLVGAFLIPRFSLREFDPVLARAYIRFGLRVQAMGAFQKTVFWVDILVIDIVLGHSTQGLYRSAYQLMVYLPLAATAVTVMLYPSLAHHHGARNTEEVRRTLSRGWFYGALIALPLAGLFAAVPETVLGLLFGPEFVPAAWILRALAFVGLLVVFLLPFESLFPAIERPDLTLRMYVVMMLVNVVLDVLLIPRIGVAGAILATAAAFAVGLAMATLQMRSLGYALPHPRDLRDLGRNG